MSMRTMSGKEMQKTNTELVWPKQFRFRAMVACPKLIPTVPLVPIEFCMERRDGKPCEYFVELKRNEKYGDRIVCAVPKERAIVKIPIKEQ